MNDDTAAGKESDTFPVIEETVQLQTQTVDAGGIRLIKSVTEEVERIPLTFRKHGYSVERVQRNEYVEEPPPALRYEGKTMIITVLEEEAVIVKRMKVVEEIRISPSDKEDIKHAEVSLKKEHITVVKDGPEE